MEGQEFAELVLEVADVVGRERARVVHEESAGEASPAAEASNEGESAEAPAEGADEGATEDSPSAEAPAEGEAEAKAE